MKKIFWTGLLAGVVITIVGMAVGYVFKLIFPALNAEFMSGLYRPWSDPLMQAYFAYPFILGWALAWAWNKTRPLFTCGSFWCRGASFGLAYWVVASIPGMFITYSSFYVSLPMIISWTVGGLLSAICAGWVFARFNNK